MVVVESNTGDPRQYVSWRLVDWHRGLVHLRQETGICHAAIESSIECGGSGRGLGRTMVRVAFILWLTLFTLHANGQALAPAAAPTAAAPAATPQPIKLGDITVTGTLRLRGYAWDWFQPASGNNEYRYSGNFLRINLSENRHAWQWNAELAVPFLLGMPLDATGTGPQQGALGFGSNYITANKGNQNAAMIFPRQLYVQFDNIGGEKGHLKIGRFTFLDGTELTPKNATLAALKRDRVTQRLLGDFGFSDIGRSFDGAHFSYSTSSSDNVTVIAALPTRGVFQVDGWGWNKA